jgi:large subunit ribosomal protein L13
MNHTIDATNKKIGRVASQAAKILMGKDEPTYAPNKAPAVTVSIINASKADVSTKKMAEELHASFSGYPSGIRVDTVAKVIGQKGYAGLFRRAIKGMLPKNKLQPIMMKHLTITE